MGYIYMWNQYGISDLGIKNYLTISHGVGSRTPVTLRTCPRPSSAVTKHFGVLLAAGQICIGNKQVENCCIVVR